MLVFWKPRLVFLATPKAGSTAIEAALGSLAALAITNPPELKHTTANRFNRFLAPYLAVANGGSFELCALMREPTDWLGSWYRYRQRDGVPPARSTRNMSFEDFVRAYCQSERLEFANVGTQSHCLRTRDGGRVQHLFRYERMEDFVDFLEDRLDCVITLPRINVSPLGRTELSVETAALLRQVLADDYALYDSLLPG
ncbi:hypothetical protein MASR2M74_32470 [Paracoccaceae bacterium]